MKTVSGVEEIKNGDDIDVNHFIFINPAPKNHSKADSSGDVGSTCRPRKNIVFIKTAKTGGSTMASVIYRYGLKHDLVAAVDPYQHALIEEDETSEHYVIQKYNCSDFPGYNIMASHIFYNRPAMEEIVPNAKYVTILRSPFTHLKSAFYFSGKNERYPNAIDPFEEFVTDRYNKFIQNGSSVYNGIQEYFPRFRLTLSSDKSEILSEIQHLDKELDLVLFTEYYDESLLLLKKFMCWNFEDILYHRMKVHQEYQAPITQREIDMLAELSAIDIQFYKYFNNTFWEKVRNYDGDFTADLAKFRSLLEDVSSECQYGNESSYCELMHIDANRLSIKSLKNSVKWIC
ncbi:galactosylceramide sulfotransferase-like [Glandiceps talaboti]